MSKHQRKRYIKSFTAIWILLCVLLITAWCIVNFVLDLRLYEHSSVIKNYVMLFVILGVVILIAVLTVFDLWGVFMRMISKTYRPHDPQARRSMETLQSELQTEDRYKSRENALRSAVRGACLLSIRDRKRLFAQAFCGGVVRFYGSAVFDRYRRGRNKVARDRTIAIAASHGVRHSLPFLCFRGYLLYPQRRKVACRIYPLQIAERFFASPVCFISVLRAKKSPAPIACERFCRAA